MEIDNIEKPITDLETLFNEIMDITNVNAISTCWTVLNLCDNCDEKGECGSQCPFTKLNLIRQMINEYKNNSELK